MNQTAVRPLASFAVLAAVLCGIEIWAAGQLGTAAQPGLVALAISADLMVGLPLLFGVLVVRRFRLPWTTVVPFGVFGAVIAYRLLPAEHRTLLEFAARFAPLLEITLLGYTAIRLWPVWKAYKALRPTTVYAGDALGMAMQRVFGNSLFVSALQAEILLIGLAFGGWFARFRSQNATIKVFFMHRSGLYPAFLFVIVCLIFGEAVVLHLLVSHLWNATAAWVCTVLSGYSLLWIIGDFHALRLHPIVLKEATLHLRRGLLWRAVVDLAEIENVRRFRSEDAARPNFVSFAPLGQGDITIILRAPVVVYGLLGMKRSVSRVGVTVDERQALLDALMT